MATPTAGGLTDPHRKLLKLRLRAVVDSRVPQVAPVMSVREAAGQMRAAGVPLLLVVERGHLFGLCTDSDLRNRILAEGLSPDTPISDAATLAPLTLSADDSGFDALLLMARHNLRHLPVTDGERLLGTVSATDLAESEALSLVQLAGCIHQQTELAGLIEASGRVRELHCQLAESGASAYSAGHLITAVTDSLSLRLLQLAEDRLGPPPVEYLWVAAGSQARSEQTSKTDQDNCLLIDDSFVEAEHGGYFQALADFVCDGLNACGYVYCPGEVMAKNPTWRQPWRHWSASFRDWIKAPEQKALMYTSVFFDVRGLHGRFDLLDRLRAQVLADTRGNGIFLAHLVGNALANRPPTGLFGRLAPDRKGEHRGTIDLKLQGLVPIVDLARVYALAGGHPEVNTQARLSRAPEGGLISAGSARDLAESHEFLGNLRLQHQARQLDAGVPADNYLPLKDLSSFERAQLKDAFAVLARLQKILQQRYRAGWF
jgi:CBS domain-containing protein